MLGYLTSNTLIESAKRKALIPTNQSTFKEADFLAFASEELKMGLLPTILQLHEEFYVYAEKISLVSKKSRYGIPYRAIGGKLRDVFYQDTAGNLVEMSRISPDDRAAFQGSAVATNYIFYYIEGNDIVLTPSVEAAVGNLVVSYYMRPNDLVSETRVGIIQNINTDDAAGTTTYYLDRIPSGFSTTLKYDLLQSKPGHKTRRYDLSSTAINVINKTITFNTVDIDTETETGDHVAFAGECIIPQCPTDLHSILAQRVAARCLEALGDTQGLTNANTKLQELEQKTTILVDQRVDGAPQKIVNRNGILGSSRFGRRRGW